MSRIVALYVPYFSCYVDFFNFASLDDSVWGSLVLVFLHLHQSGNLWFVFSHLMKKIPKCFYNISMDSIDFFLTLWLILQFARTMERFYQQASKMKQSFMFYYLVGLLEILGLVCKKSNHNLSFWRVGDLTVCCLSVSKYIKYYILGCWAGPKKTTETCDLSLWPWNFNVQFVIVFNPKKMLLICG